MIHNHTNPEVSALPYQLGHILKDTSVLPCFLKPSQLPEEAAMATHTIMSERTALGWVTCPGLLATRERSGPVLLIPTVMCMSVCVCVCRHTRVELRVLGMLGKCSTPAPRMFDIRHC